MQAKCVHYSDVIPMEVSGDGAQGVEMRLVLGPDDGADNFHLRILTFAAGGCSPHHTHDWEHENYIMSGTGELEIEGEIFPLKPGFVALVPPGKKHQYRSADGMEMICLIPDPKA